MHSQVSILIEGQKLFSALAVMLEIPVPVLVYHFTRFLYSSYHDIQFEYCRKYSFGCAFHAMNVPSLQVDLVLSWVSQECRAGVRDAALGELRCLASAAPHAWSQGNVAALVSFTRAARTPPSDGGEGLQTSGLAGLSIGGGEVEGGKAAMTGEGGVKGVLTTASEHDKTTAAALEVLATLTSAPALPHLHLTPGEPLMNCCNTLVLLISVEYC